LTVEGEGRSWSGAYSLAAPCSSTPTSAPPPHTPELEHLRRTGLQCSARLRAQPVILSLRGVSSRRKHASVTGWSPRPVLTFTESAGFIRIAGFNRTSGCNQQHGESSLSKDCRSRRTLGTRAVSPARRVANNLCHARRRCLHHLGSQVCVNDSPSHTLLILFHRNCDIPGIAAHCSART
jgi:hypothetical protein